MKRLPTFTPLEERLHALTHGFGTLLAALGASLLIVSASQNGDAWRIVSFSIYGGTLFVLYLFSTLYHSFQNPRVKFTFRILDHCAIYFLIAGTYTPIALVTLRGGWGWSFFGIAWGLAFLGTLFKIFFVHRFRFLSTLIYVGMGWMVVVGGRHVLGMIPATALIWIFVGGFLYTLGAVVYLLKQVRYHHVVWHLLVLGGSFCHYTALLFYVLPASA